MQSSSCLMGPRLFPLPPPQHHAEFLFLPHAFFSPRRGRLDVSGWPCFRPWHKVPRTALWLLRRGGGCENALFLKRTKNTRDPAKPVFFSALQTVDRGRNNNGRHCDSFTHGLQRTPHMSECLHLLHYSLGRRRQQQKLLGPFICQVKRYVVVLLSLFSLHPKVWDMRLRLLYSHMQLRASQEEKASSLK